MKRVTSLFRVKASASSTMTLLKKLWLRVCPSRWVSYAIVEIFDKQARITERNFDSINDLYAIDFIEMQAQYCAALEQHLSTGSQNKNASLDGPCNGAKYDYRNRRVARPNLASRFN